MPYLVKAKDKIAVDLANKLLAAKKADEGVIKLTNEEFKAFIKNKVIWVK